MMRNVVHAVISEHVSSAMRAFVAIVKMLEIAQTALVSAVHTVATDNAVNAIKSLAISAQSRMVCFVKAVISTSAQIVRSIRPVMMTFPPTLFVKLRSIIVLTVLIIGIVMIAK